MGGGGRGGGSVAAVAGGGGRQVMDKEIQMKSRKTNLFARNAFVRFSVTAVCSAPLRYSCSLAFVRATEASRSFGAKPENICHA